MFNFLYRLYRRYCLSLSKSACLERLSNELLLEILSYASVSDLFNSWLNLNWRFDTLVYSLSIRAIYIKPKQKTIVINKFSFSLSDLKSNWISNLIPLWNQLWYLWRTSENDVQCLHYFASRIITLRIDEYFLSVIRNQINIIDYSNVRILKLDGLNENELDQIHAENFPYLEHLSLFKTKEFSLKVLCQFKSLRSCQFFSLKIDIEDSNSSSIQSIVIKQCFLWDMSIIFHHFPQMIFFSVYLCLFNDDIVRSKPIIKFVHPNLRSFHIGFLDTSFWMNDTDDDDEYNDIFVFLTSISFDKHIHYYLSLVNI